MGFFFSRMRRDPLFCVLAALLLLWIAAMFAVPPFLSYDAYTNDMGARLLPPSAEHILGTDQLGRDLLSRVLVGGQASLSASLVSGILSAVFGIGVGAAMALTRGRMQLISTGIVDFFLAFPSRVFLVALLGFLGPNVGNVILDLRGMPADEADRLSTINAHLDLGRLLVKTDDDQPVTVKADVGMGSVESRVSQAWTVNNRQMYHDNDDEAPTTYDVNGKTFPTYSDVNGGLNVKSTLTSPSKEDGRPTITINAAVSIGSISVEELSDGVSWYGNAKESVWIVSSWSDERGNAHRGSLPVPGMTHQAITADNAEACIRSAHASENADDRSSGVTWHDLSDLTSKERTSYDACVQKALAGQSAAEPSANPTGETTPSPSQAPTDAG